MRIGQKNKLTYRWARKGSRPRAIHDQRTQSTYLFGAVCPERGAGAALVLPACNTEAMQLHLDEIATKIAPGAHAILLLDQAGWHGAKALKVPNNISLLQLPPRAPELNGRENIWQFMRQNWLSNRIFQFLRRYRRRNWKIRFDNQFCRMNCQIFSRPLSSGARGGSCKSEMLFGTLRALAPCQPA